MRVRCQTNTAEKLPECWFKIGDTKQTKFSEVTAGREYEVYAMSLWGQGIVLLTADDRGMPHWLPVDIFEILDDAVPSWWHFARLSYPESDVGAIWGYKEIVSDPAHYDGLIELEPEALRKFFFVVDEAKKDEWERKL